MRQRSFVVGVLLTLAVSVVSAGELPERFRGTIAVVGGSDRVAGLHPEVTVHADRLPGDEIFTELAKVLAHEGEEALLRAIKGLPAVGWIAIGDNPPAELKLIRSLGTGQVRQLRFLTSQPIQYDELWIMTRSPDYNYGFVELVLDENGEGEGTIMPAAAIEIRDARIMISSLAIHPVRILQVHPEDLAAGATKSE